MSNQTESIPFLDSHQKQICTPGRNTCPAGYSCRKSLVSPENVCCTSNNFDTIENRFEGYCPPGQVPYLQPNTIEPSPCHMALSPCPNTAPYQCIYSAEKQNSFCCTPTGTANLPFTYHSRRPQSNNIQMHPQQHPQQSAASGSRPQASQTMMVSNNLPPSDTAQPQQQFITGPNGEQLTRSMIPIQLLSSEKQMLPAALPGAPESGCPSQTQPLLNGETRQPHPCSTMARCPEGFTCYSNYPDGRNAQCCTTMPSNEDDAAFMRAMQPGKIREPIKVCPQGFIKLGSVCKRSKSTLQLNPQLSTPKLYSVLRGSTRVFLG